MSRCTPRPIRWRLALVTWLALAIVVTLISHLGRPMFDAMPTVIDTVALTGVVVVLMTWLVMPPLTRRLASFLTGPVP